jgi:hypothetical protein
MVAIYREAKSTNIRAHKLPPLDPALKETKAVTVWTPCTYGYILMILYTWGGLQTGFGLVSGCIGHLQLATTSNMDLHSPHITTERTLSSQAVVFTRSLVTASNGRFSPISGFTNCPRATVTAILSYPLYNYYFLKKVHCRQSLYAAQQLFFY